MLVRLSYKTYMAVTTATTNVETPIIQALWKEFHIKKAAWQIGLPKRSKYSASTPSSLIWNWLRVKDLL